MLHDLENGIENGIKNGIKIEKIIYVVVCPQTITHI